MNFASPSAWERFVWGPFTLILAVLCLLVARKRLRRPRLIGGRDAPRSVVLVFVLRVLGTGFGWIVNLTVLGPQGEPLHPRVAGGFAARTGSSEQKPRCGRPAGGTATGTTPVSRLMSQDVAY
jgi:hypothetical protein